MSPLSVYSRGSHAFSVSPTVPQLLGAAGTNTNPTYSFAGATNTGIYTNGGGEVTVCSNGTRMAAFLSGVLYLDTIREFTGSNNAGFALATASTIASISGAENFRITAGVFQASKGTADAVAYALNVRKSRGTVASPTAITTGDDLSVISAYGYVGATNTYQEAGRLTIDSVGTITDSTNGVGGIFRFSNKKQGTDLTVQERYRIDDLGHLISVSSTANTPTISANGGTNPTIVGTDDAFRITVGSGGTASTVTVSFGSSYPTAPISVANHEGSVLALRAASSVSTVTIDAATPFTAGGIIDCICRGIA
jgi:hypothetical protein